MKKFRNLSLLFAMMLLLCFAFVGCSSKAGMGDWLQAPTGAAKDEAMTPDENYQYNEVIETPFLDVAEYNKSFFSLDRNTAGYSYVRRQIMSGQGVPADSVRTEELINYFDYGYPAPTGEEVVKATTYLTDCPWNEKNKLLTIGVKTKEIKTESQKNNFVFLIDVSGSMYGRDRLDLVKFGVNKLIDGLTSEDRVSIVTYCGGVSVNLESTLLDENGKKQAKKVVDGLKANGSTNGSGGIKKAYEIAERQKADGVNSRVILMSDGDFNVGMRSEEEMEELIKQKAQTGVYLSVLGFGMGNTRDDMLETLARNGNGNYAYIDNQLEAEKVLCHELNGMLVTVLKDAKAGVTFTDSVKKYRLIGYDTKLITEDDFNDEKKDTGEIGSNLSVTAMYEIELNENALEGDELANVEIRYKNVSKNEESESITAKVTNNENYEDRIGFAACVAEFGLVLRNSKYKENASLQNVLERLQALETYTDGDTYKQEFAAIVAKATEIYKEQPEKSSYPLDNPAFYY